VKAILTLNSAPIQVPVEMDVKEKNLDTALKIEL
jgi:hypothetical protein